tara:strand:- start:743 stop:844 length:102 start_codon:yes stop_codon:yes gene_type:complete
MSAENVKERDIKITNGELFQTNKKLREEYKNKG